MVRSRGLRVPPAFQPIPITGKSGYGNGRASRSATGEEAVRQTWDPICTAGPICLKLRYRGIMCPVGLNRRRISGSNCWSLFLKIWYNQTMAISPEIEADPKGTNCRCLWCHRAFTRRATGGSAQKFCSTGHRQAFWVAARRWTMRAIETGLLSVDCLKAPQTSVHAAGGAFQPQGRVIGP